MGNFCEKCGSLLRWDFSDGKKERICPRCGCGKGANVFEGNGGMVRPKNSKKNGVRSDGKKGPLGKGLHSRSSTSSRYSVRKGTSPRGSGYARCSLHEASTRVVSRSELARSVRDARNGTGKGSHIDSGKEPPGFFPFDMVRKGQWEFMEDVRSAVKNGRFLLANVPTGIGKTAASLSPALEQALKEKKLLFFMTSKQSQHRIAVETLRGLSKKTGRRIRVVDIVSKQTMCPREISRLPHPNFSFLCREQSKDGTCPLFKQPPTQLKVDILSEIMDVSEIVDVCSQYGICPHRAALEAAREADVLICDFNYLFSDLSDPVLSGLGKKLSDVIIIVDEAHNLPQRIRDHLSQELPLRLLEDAVDTIGKKRHLKHYLKGFRELVLRQAKERLGDEREVLLDKREFVSEIRALFQGSLGSSFDLETFIDMLGEYSMSSGLPEEEDPVMNVCQFLSGMLKMGPAHILYLSVPEGRSVDSLRLCYRNLDPGEISGPIFKGGHSAVLMSGTLSPPSMFGDILGMAGSRRDEKEYPSPFPSGNLLVLQEKGVTTAYRSRTESMFRRIGERITSLVGRFPGNVAVFFPSYSILQRTRENMWGCPKPMIVEDREMSRSDREEMIERLKKARVKGGAILFGVMGGSLSEGIDYRDNLLSGVFIVGLPLAPPSLEVMSLRDHYRRKFGRALGDDYSYTYPAVNRIMQAAGRSIRSEADRAVVVLMEERMTQQRYLRFLPEHLRPSRIEDGSMEQAIDAFFGY